MRHILDRRTSIPKVLSVLRAATVPRSTEILPMGFDSITLGPSPLSYRYAMARPYRDSQPYGQSLGFPIPPQPHLRWDWGFSAKRSLLAYRLEGMWLVCPWGLIIISAPFPAGAPYPAPRLLGRCRGRGAIFCGNDVRKPASHRWDAVRHDVTGGCFILVAP